MSSGTARTRHENFTRDDLKPRIASEIRTDKQTLLSGAISGEIRRLLEAAWRRRIS